MDYNFTYNSKKKEYYLKENDIEISFDAELMNQETAVYAVEILAAYSEKLSILCDVLLNDEGFIAFFGNVKKDEMSEKLHTPSIRILDENEGLISYCNHEYDDTHILDIEFSGILEDFSNVSVDG